ncbi:MAG: DUF4214 domain-containing protein, partial [Pirellulales bacterium]
MMRRDHVVLHGLSSRRPARKRRLAKLEALEARALLTTFYVDSGLLVTADRDHSGGLSPGDQVTFGNGQSYQQADLTYDAAPVDGDVGTAFSSIGQALASPLVQAGDIIDIAGGTYTEAVTIDKSITLQGFGDVVLFQEPSPQGQPVVGTGITIENDPDSVTLADIDVRGFGTGLSSAGAGTINLADVTLEAGGRPTIFADPFNELSNVTNLNIVDTTNQNEQVDLSSGPPLGSIPFVQTNSLAIALENVTNLSITANGGGNTFNVSPIAKTMTIEGANVPPATDTLNIYYPTLTGNSLSEVATPQGYSGTVDFSGGFGYPPVGLTPPDVLTFSHIVTVLPGVNARGGQDITATEGVAIGAVQVAEFSDPICNLPSDYSADIRWGDGTTSAGSISFNSSTGVYSITGNHTYTEEGDDLVDVVIHRQGSPDTTETSSASVVEQPIVATAETLAGTAGVALGSGGQALVASFSQDQIGKNENFQATIDWGDGTTSSGTITVALDVLPPSVDRTIWSVYGSHTYAQPRSYSIRVSLTEGTNSVSSVNSTATIAAASLTPNQQFITHVYADLLHRTAEAGGLTYWSGQLDGGLARTQLVLEIEASAEYRQDEISSLYEHYLHRAPESAAVAAGSQLLAQGMTDEQLAAI